MKHSALVIFLVVILCGWTLSPVLAQPEPPSQNPGVQKGPHSDPGDGQPGPNPRQDEMTMKKLMKEWAKDRPREEVEAYQKQVQKIREKSELWIQMAHLYMEKKEPAKALETIRKVFAIEIPAGPLKGEMEKKKGHLYLMAVQMAFESGNEEQAQQLVDEALKNVQDQPDVAFHLYRRMADIQRKKGNTDEALKLLEKAEAILNQL